jgi:hypothetical protein
MKDLVLWQSTAARERESRRLRDLAALHQSPDPPRELLQRLPRKLRLKIWMRWIMGFDVFLLVFALVLSSWIIQVADRASQEEIRNTRLGNDRIRDYVSQATDLEKKAKAEKTLREGEELVRKQSLDRIRVLAVICLIATFGPVLYFVLSWLRLRPELNMLRLGTPARAVITARKDGLFVSALQTSFTTDRGEVLQKWHVVFSSEVALFHEGSSIWMLYMPSRPNKMRIYGLKTTLAEVVTDTA